MRRRGSLLVAVIVLAAPPSASTQTPRPDRPGAVQVSPTLRVVGLGRGGVGELSLAGAGDVNGDGLPDVLVGTPYAGPRGRKGAGAAHVIFGSRTRRTVDARSLGSAGYRIDGAEQLLPPLDFEETQPGDRAGYAVAGTGDVNRDGLADVAVGAPAAGASLRAESGSVYVVFGKRTPDSVDLGELGSRGYRIDGDLVGGGIGNDLGAAGDVDGDGIADLAVGSFGSSAYVVFGKADSSTVDLRAAGAGAMRIRVEPEDDEGGYAVGDAGDVDGDGRSDVIVGDHDAKPRGRRSAGSAFVVFGGARTAGVDLTAPATRTLRIDGAKPEEHIGRGVGRAGDVNGDGRSDVVVGGFTDDEFGDEAWPGGVVYVIYGRRSRRGVDLGRLQGGGFRIRAGAGEELGAAFAPAGDVNRDGRDDVALGAPGLDHGCRADSGAVHVVLGGARRDVDLRRPRGAAYTYAGAGRASRAGAALAAVGDMTDDGRPELITAAAGSPDVGVKSAIVDAFQPAPGLGPRPRRGSSCLGFTVRRTTPRALGRGKRLVVRVTAKEARPVFTTLEVSVWLVRRGRDLYLGSGSKEQSRVGRHRIAVSLSRRGRRILTRRRSVRLRVEVLQQGVANQPARVRTKRLVLRR